MFFKNVSSYWLVAMLLMLNLGCGGSGGSSDDNDNNGGNSPTWTVNVFEDESEFKNFCQVPRSGVDPFTNRAYPDRSGTTLQENHWLRSWSNNTYLWYDEIEDINPAGFANTLDYFDILKTEELSPSGQPKDKFHFTFDSAEYQQLS